MRTAGEKRPQMGESAEALFIKGLQAICLEDEARRRIWGNIEARMKEPDSDRKKAESRLHFGGNGSKSHKSRQKGMAWGGAASSPSPRKNRNRRLWLPAACCAGALCLVGIGMGIDRLLLMGGGSLWGEVTELDTASSGSDTDIYVIPAESSFTLNGKRYEQAGSGSAQIWGRPLPSAVSEESLGAAVGTISGSGELDGETVYTYTPAGGEALVAVSLDGRYRLYVFSNFLSYEENGDEDAEEYLKVYGADGPEDLLSVELLEYPDGVSEYSLGVLSEEEKGRFYSLFSGLKEKSAQYFQALSSYETQNAQTSSSAAEEAEPPPAESFTAVFDPGGTAYLPADSYGKAAEDNAAAASQSAVAGVSHALDDSVCVRITFKSGLTREFWYYPRIGFLSRFEAAPELQKLLEDCGAPAA